MAFKNMRLDLGVMFGSGGGDGFADLVATDAAGNETRELLHGRDLGEWMLTLTPRTVSRLKDLRAFFKIANGRVNTWRLRDPDDYIVSTGEGVFTQIDSTHFQMWKRWSYSGYTFDNKVVLPVSGTISITGGSGHSIDYSAPSGIVTVTSGTPTAWTGQRDKLARFDTSKLGRIFLDRSGGDLFVKCDPIPIKEVLA